jgi:hypothetical protein
VAFVFATVKKPQRGTGAAVEAQAQGRPSKGGQGLNPRSFRVLFKNWLFIFDLIHASYMI